MLAAAVLFASPARSAESSLPPGVETLPEAWSAPGGAGFVGDFAMGTGLPFNFLGLVAGSVAERGGLLPETAPWPGIPEIAAPTVWFDSTAIVVGEGGAWRGFGGSLVELRAIAQPPVGRKPRAAFTLVNGSSAVNRTGLLMSRGGDASWMRGGVLDDERAGAGILSRRGQHVWFAELGRRLGAHTFSGTFSQRGLAGGTRLDTRFVEPFFRPPFFGFDEAGRGESGGLTWRWSGSRRSLVTTVSRSHDHRESVEPASGLLRGEREGQSNAVTIEATAGGDGREHGLRLELRQSQVRRREDQSLLLVVNPPPSRTIERSAWLAARDQRPLGAGTLELAVGGGRSESPALSGERWQAAPSLVWRLGPASRQLRLVAERVVTPIWSDLAPGVKPFVQDVWAAGVDASLGAPARQWLRLGLLGADIGNRAALVRFPLRDISLRIGWTPDAERVQDAMVTVAAGARRGAWAIEASGFSRVRPAGTEPAKVDPAIGARAAAETGFRAFAGDLGVRLRVEAAWVGERESESFPGYFSPPQPLEGYATYGGSAALTLGDATIVVRAQNLEDVAHPQTWTDPSSPFPGTPAPGSARQFRVELSWPFFN